MKNQIIALVLLAVTTVGHGQTDKFNSVKIDGDTPWLVFEDDYDNMPIQKAIRDAERAWSGCAGR